ncbi:hypothetical protein [Streptomyces sp. GC420]|uniref:hypothetical protein n=1 Tax=Streptomyces sp. GC420 TaxID=2697568 RepID=UPI00141527B5|nr:hypothetical protein [Streptomyces sp. GC420]NBM20782.1 hypothetical protein [Streptomyces sp. GC420]
MGVDSGEPMRGLAAELAKALEDPAVRARVVPLPWEAAVLAKLGEVLPRLAEGLAAAAERPAAAEARLSLRRATPVRY